MARKQEVFMENLKLKDNVGNAGKKLTDETELIDTEECEIKTNSPKEHSKQRKGKSLNQIRIEDHELFKENKRLKERCNNNAKSKPSVDESAIDFGSRTIQNTSDLRKTKVLLIAVISVFGLLFLGMAAFTIYAWTQISRTRDMTTWLIDKQQQLLQTNPNSQGLLQSLLVGNKDKETPLGALQKNYFNVGMNSDNRLQECQGSQLKQTFPDIDYAFFGYNILKGYPLSVGHDPGFTYPIFIADYSEERQTSDCRYSLPKGLVVVPDVSCVTSFTSTTVQTKYEYSRSLSVSANAKGGGWGVSFSASVGYKQASSEISSGESVFILSTAKCIYYFSKLVQDNPPQFSKTFLDWVSKLNDTDDKDTYFEFFEVFGTHFSVYTTFGSRYTYEHKMSSSSYQTKRESGVNVNVQASYSGIFSVSGGLKMDSSQKQAASDFQNSVETKTVTVGAPPPADGDAMTWASSVKESPVPMEYDLVSIENLFSEKYMANMNIDYKTIADRIKINQYAYCNYLKDLNQLDSCESLSPGVVLKNTRFLTSNDNYQLKTASNIGECIDMCLQDLKCMAITYCKACDKNEHMYLFYQYTSSYSPWKVCLMLKSGGNFTGEAKQLIEFESIVFISKIKSELRLLKTEIDGISRSSQMQSISTEEECKLSCISDAYCVAYTFSTGQVVKPCNIYAEERINGLKKEDNTITYFMSNRLTILEPSNSNATDTSNS